MYRRDEGFLKMNKKNILMYISDYCRDNNLLVFIKFFIVLLYIMYTVINLFLKEFKIGCRK